MRQAHGRSARGLLVSRDVVQQECVQLSFLILATGHNMILFLMLEGDTKDKATAGS